MWMQYDSNFFIEMTMLMCMLILKQYGEKKTINNNEVFPLQKGVCIYVSCNEFKKSYIQVFHCVVRVHIPCPVRYIPQHWDRNVLGYWKCSPTCQDKSPAEESETPGISYHYPCHYWAHHFSQKNPKFFIIMHLALVFPNSSKQGDMLGFSELIFLQELISSSQQYHQKTKTPLPYVLYIQFGIDLLLWQ
jgi:hypothetical protein